MTGSGAVGGAAGPAWDPLGLAGGVVGGKRRQVLFADSSGNPRSLAGDDAYYTLGGVTGSHGELSTLSKMLYGLKLGLVPGRDPRSWELHGVRITHRSRRYPLWPRTEGKRLEVFGAITEAICESGVTLFGIMVDNKRAREKSVEGAGAIDTAWTFLLERYEIFMRRRGEDVTGHVVADKAWGADMQLIHTLVSSSSRLRNPMSGVRTSRVAGIKFVDSVESPLVQAADIVAYILSRHVNGDERFGRMARRLLERMWMSGKWRGWKPV